VDIIVYPDVNVLERIARCFSSRYSKFKSDTIWSLPRVQRLP